LFLLLLPKESTIFFAILRLSAVLRALEEEASPKSLSSLSIDNENRGEVLVAFVIFGRRCGLIPLLVGDVGRSPKDDRAAADSAFDTREPFE